MLNTSEIVDISVRNDIVDSFGQIMLNSGHKLPQVRSIPVSGLKGYEARKKSSLTSGWRPLDMCASEGSAGRRMKNGKLV